MVKSMKIGVVGSRRVMVDKLERFIPNDCEKIISGGAVGADKCAAEYAKRRGIELMEILPEYKKYGKAAPIIRNKLIVNESDQIIAFWDGSSKGTKSVIEYCEKINKPCTVVMVSDNEIQVKLNN